MDKMQQEIRVKMDNLRSSVNNLSKSIQVLTEVVSDIRAEQTALVNLKLFELGQDHENRQALNKGRTAEYIFGTNNVEKKMKILD